MVPVPPAPVSTNWAGVYFVPTPTGKLKLYEPVRFLIIPASSANPLVWINLLVPAFEIVPEAEDRVSKLEPILNFRVSAVVVKSIFPLIVVVQFAVSPVAFPIVRLLNVSPVTPK